MAQQDPGVVPQTGQTSVTPNQIHNMPLGITTTAVYTNTQQEVIIVTKDKARLCLHDHLEKMKKREEWVAPFGILVSLIFSLLTSDFKKILGVSADAWKAVFVVAALISFAFLVKALFGMRRSVNVEDVVKALSEAPPSTPGGDPAPSGGNGTAS